MKRDVTVGPSLAESHLTILQAVSAKQQQSQGQRPAWHRLAISPCCPNPDSAVLAFYPGFITVPKLGPQTPPNLDLLLPSLDAGRVLPSSMLCSLSSE